MNTQTIRTCIVLNIVMSALSLQASAPKADVYHSHYSGSREFAYQYSHCRTIHNNGDNTGGDKRFLKITLAPHIPFNTTTPNAASERYARLENAIYRVGNNTIDLSSLNDDSLSIRIKKAKDNSVILSAHQGWPKFFKRSVYLCQYFPFNRVAEPHLQPGAQLNFKDMQIKRVVDGNSLPRWVVEIMIPIDENTTEVAQNSTKKADAQWRSTPREDDVQMLKTNLWRSIPQENK